MTTRTLTVRLSPASARAGVPSLGVTTAGSSPPA